MSINRILTCNRCSRTETVSETSRFEWLGWLCLHATFVAVFERPGHSAVDEYVHEQRHFCQDCKPIVLSALQSALTPISNG